MHTDLYADLHRKKHQQKSAAHQRKSAGFVPPQMYADLYADLHRKKHQQKSAGTSAMISGNFSPVEVHRFVGRFIKKTSANISGTSAKISGICSPADVRRSLRRFTDKNISENQREFFLPQMYADLYADLQIKTSAKISGHISDDQREFFPRRCMLINTENNQRESFSHLYLF